MATNSIVYYYASYIAAIIPIMYSHGMLLLVSFSDASGWLPRKRAWDLVGSRFVFCAVNRPLWSKGQTKAASDPLPNWSNFLRECVHGSIAPTIQETSFCHFIFKSSCVVLDGLVPRQLNIKMRTAFILKMYLISQRNDIFIDTAEPASSAEIGARCYKMSPREDCLIIFARGLLPKVTLDT